MPPPPNAARCTRYSGLITARRLHNTHALIIGVGAIGNTLAKLLAQTGVGQFTLFDPDTVSVVNLGPQGFNERDLDHPKVDATSEACEALNGDLTTYTHEKPFDADLLDPHNLPNIAFLCVDSMSARQYCFADLVHYLPAPAHLIDARMNALQARILTVGSPAPAEGTPLTVGQYLSTLDLTLDSNPDPCTARSTSWTANIAAALMLSQMIKVLTKTPLHGDFIFSVNSCMITLIPHTQELPCPTTPPSETSPQTSTEPSPTPPSSTLPPTSTPSRPNARPSMATP